MKTDRVKALTDGVLAIVLTILVLGFEVPDHDFDRAGLLGFLHSMRHALLAYVVSFGIVAAYWVQHAAILHFVRRADRRFVWINMLFMLPLTLLPFLTALRAEYHHEERVTAIYAFVNATCGLMLLLLWKHALRRGLATDAAAEVDRSMTGRILLGVGINALGGAVAPINALLSSLVFLTLPLVYISHAAVDRRWYEEVAPADAAR
jgi:uncharacterized membrane protein